MPNPTAQNTLLCVALAAAIAAAPRADACSMCRCGDPAYSMVGSQIFMPKRLRVGFDFERFAKDQVAAHHHGDHEHEGDEPLGREDEVEERYTLSLGYTAGKRLTLLARLPFAQRAITTGGATERLNGVADPELSAHWRVLSSSKRPGTWLALAGGVTLGWGQNAKRLEGQRADEHLQPGSGATAASASLSFARLLDSGVELFGSLGGRFNGRNDAGYHYGHVFLANLAAERLLFSRVNGVVELNYRSAARDETTPGEADENTGGAVLYVSPKLLLKLDPRQNLWLRVGVQVPVVEDLHGDQDEKLNVLAGLTVRF